MSFVGRLSLYRRFQATAHRTLCPHADAGSEELMESTPTFAVEPRNTTAPPGSRVVLECAGRGRPPPLVSWTGESLGGLPRGLLGGTRVEVTGSLVIESMSSEHAGIYVCLLTNRDDGTLIARKEVHLTLQGMSMVLLSYYNKSQWVWSPRY